MAGEHLTNMLERSDQEKREIIAKAQQARKESNERLTAYAQEHYRVYEDDKEWAEMAREFGVRLPRYIDQPTKKNIRKFAKKIGKDVSWVRECWGLTDLDDIANLNPDMSMRYVAGVMIEDILQENE